MKVTLAKADAVGAKADHRRAGVRRDGAGPGAEEAVAALGVPVAPLLEGPRVHRQGRRGGRAGHPRPAPGHGAAAGRGGGAGQGRCRGPAMAGRAAVVRQGRGARKAVTTLTQACANQPPPLGGGRRVLAAYRFDKYKHAKANGSAGRAGHPGAGAGAGRGPGVGRPGRLTGAWPPGRCGPRPPTWPGTCPTSRPTPCTRPTSPPPPARLLAGRGVTVKVKNEKELAAEGFGGIIEVGQGPTTRPG